MNRTSVCLFFAALWLMVPWPGFGQGGLMVTPQRVTFDGKSRVQTVTVINRSQARQSFRLFFSEKRMTEAGLLADIEDPAEGFYASPLIRFSPRRVTLAPGQSQKVKLLVHKTAHLEPGEYRSHLVFQVIPEAAGLTLEAAHGESGGIGVKLTPLFGTSIPIIVRHGDLSAQVEIVQTELDRVADQPQVNLSLVFKRTGNRSVYGDVLIEHVSQDGQVTEMSQVKGMAIYTDIQQRTLDMALMSPAADTFQNGHLRITYTARDSQTILAIFDLALNP